MTTPRFEYLGVILLLVLLGGWTGDLVAGLTGAWIGFAVGTAATVLPVAGSNVLTHLFGIIGPLSAGSLVAISASIASIVSDRISPSDVFLSGSLAGLGLILYPFSLGLSSIDPYAFGYRGALLPAALLLVAGLAWTCGSAYALAWLALTAVLFLAGVYLSRNLWDYLLDPIVWIASLAWIGVEGLRSLPFHP